MGTEEIEVAFLLGNASFNHYILAISIGAVFFGANTYIGNGPNFMVKIIADQQKIPTPGFGGLVFRYTLPCMAPDAGPDLAAVLPRVSPGRTARIALRQRPRFSRMRP